MNKIKTFSHKVFYDNKALLVFSFVLAVVIWLVVMLGFAPVDTRTITDIVVEIDAESSTLSSLDLMPFGVVNNTVDITIEGKRYIIYDDMVDKDSFKAVAKTTYVSSPGKYALQIEVSKKNEKGEYEIIELSKEYIEVYFDVLKEIDIPISPKVQYSKSGLVKEGYVEGTPYLSSKNVALNKITVSGPATEVNAIKNVYGEVALSNPLDKTTTENAVINAYNDKGGLVHNLSFEDAEFITVTQPVYQIIDEPVKPIVEFRNIPQAYSQENIKCEFSVTDLNVAVENPTDVNNNKELSIKTIDFAELKPGKNTMTVKTEKLSSVYFYDDIEEITITVTLDDFSEKTVEFDDNHINYENLPDDFIIGDIKKSIGNITVYGPEDSLKTLRAADIYAEIDLSELDVNAKEQTFTATINIENNNDCWAYGTYTITLVNQ